MLKRRLLLLIFGLSLSGCRVGSLGNKIQGALQVTSNQVFEVYLDETHLGQTPFFDEHIKTGEYVLKLASVSGDRKAVWQAKVKIAKRTLTVVNYSPSTHPEESSSEVLYLEPLQESADTKLTITTLPDNVVIHLNGEVQGFSPLTLNDLGAGEYDLKLEAPGYKEKTINIKVTQGHHLLVQAHLAREILLGIEKKEQTASASAVWQDEEFIQLESSASAASSSLGKVEAGVYSGAVEPSDLKKPFVRILQATAGLDWLRVRSEPNGLQANELAKVKVGTYFPFVEDSENQEWYKIEYDRNKFGWISAKYGELNK